MIRYVPSSAAESLSEALWALSRPAGVRQTGSTRFLFPWVDDRDGKRWLKVVINYGINVHTEASIGAIADILAPWVGHGIEQADIDALTVVVESHRGGTVTPWEFFPQVFKDLSKTHQEMIDAGSLEEPNITP